MSAQLLNTILLPMALASMMLALGLSLQPGNFAKVFNSPRAIAMGLLLQLIGLPLMAWLIIALTSPSLELAAALILIALAPGGATSNAITYLSRGDTALSISLTAITSLVTPFTLPVLLSLQYQWLGIDSEELRLPILPTMAKLVVVTLIPVVTGMALRHRFPSLIQSIQQPIQKVVGLLFIALIVALSWVNHQRLPEILSSTSLSVLSLSVLAMLVANQLSRAARLSPEQEITLTIETGIQNAGTAIMIAASLMGQPALAMIALYYGIAMNLPALMIIGWRCRSATETHCHSGC
ncbi:MAG: Na(+)-dependent transporter [Gammaproteobacteria bacterium]|nr:MAG: Na(+)-dependent transporter [Gammaproteobacteria bacterium]